MLLADELLAVAAQREKLQVETEELGRGARGTERLGVLPDELRVFDEGLGRDELEQALRFRLLARVVELALDQRLHVFACERPCSRFGDEEQIALTGAIREHDTV